MESKTKEKRAKHKDEFKREAVRLLETRRDRTIADVAASLGVAKSVGASLHGTAHEPIRNHRVGEGESQNRAPNASLSACHAARSTHEAKAATRNV